MVGASFSLLSKAWLPVLRADGARQWIRPAEITSGAVGNPVTAFAWGRPDFDAASREFMIGLLATACAGRCNDRQWREWYASPPDPAVLDDLFAPLAPAFDLCGTGKAFMQDIDPLEGEAVPVGQLLIEAPGANTLKKNLDHFVRRGRVEVLCPAAAAMALFTLQTFAPSGGAGHRTSLRGGGPLTTLVRPGPMMAGAPDALWRLLWANVVVEAGPAMIDAALFPWLGPTRVSDKGQTMAFDDMQPQQAYWGMPRRIRLAWTANDDGMPCSLTGGVAPMVARHYRTRPWGINYTAQRHPLTPHYRSKTTGEWLPVHGQPGRIGWRHWLGLVAAPAGETARPADAVATATKRLRLRPQAERLAARLMVAGYDMDNMKARDFIEAEMPLHLVDDGIADRFHGLVHQAVEGGRLVARQLTGALHHALRGPGTAMQDGGTTALGRDRFWDATEAPFHDLLVRAADGFAATDEEGQDQAAMATRRAWLKVLRNTALAIFDELAPLTDPADTDPRQVGWHVAARRFLIIACAGAGPSGARIFSELGLPPPGGTGGRGRKQGAKAQGAGG